MSLRVILLRGINVGGHGRLSMEDLRASLTDLGCASIRTYIQSGNAVCRCETSPATLARSLEEAIEASHGLRPSVLAMDDERFEAVLAANPFPDAVSDPGALHVGFLKRRPEAPDRKRLGAVRADSERYVLSEEAFYLHAPDGIGRSRLVAVAERSIGVPMTMRNWRTADRLAGLLREARVDTKEGE